MEFNFDLTNHEIGNGIHTNHAAAVEDKRKCPIKFYWGDKYMSFESDKQARPVFEKTLYAQKKIIGDRWNQPGATEIKFVENMRGDKVPDPKNNVVRVYAQELKHFLEHGAKAINGTPLSQWPQITTDMVKVCEMLEINSVEELAQCATHDTVIQKLGIGGRELTARAAAYVESAKDGRVAEKLAAELAQEKQRNELLAKQMADLTEKVNEITASKGKRSTKGEE